MLMETTTAVVWSERASMPESLGLTRAIVLLRWRMAAAEDSLFAGRKTSEHAPAKAINALKSGFSQ